jgi:protein phosphatase
MQTHEKHSDAEGSSAPETVPVQRRVDPARVRVEVGALTHTGKVRPNNEDQFFVARLTKSLEVLTTSLPAGHVPAQAALEGYVMLVADGIGGAAGGERASTVVVEEAREHILHTARWFYRMDDPDEEVRRRRLRETLERIDRRLIEEADRDPTLAGMGTTLTAASSVGADLFIVHVGDSRAYLSHADRLVQLTRDHTLAQRLVEAGVLAPEEAQSSRLRNVLTNALGGQLGVHADVYNLRLSDGDRLLLCSDGLTDMVPDDRIAEVLRGHPDPDGACAALIEAALAGGGKDNVTVVVANYAIGPAGETGGPPPFSP